MPDRLRLPNTVEMGFPNIIFMGHAGNPCDWRAVSSAAGHQDRILSYLPTRSPLTVKCGAQDPMDLGVGAPLVKYLGSISSTHDDWKRYIMLSLGIFGSWKFGFGENLKETVRQYGHRWDNGRQTQMKDMATKGCFSTVRWLQLLNTSVLMVVTVHFFQWTQVRTYVAWSLSYRIVLVLC